VIHNIKQMDARGELIKYEPSLKKMLISLGPKKTILVNGNQGIKVAIGITNKLY
jgi:hypothetical protein